MNNLDRPLIVGAGPIGLGAALFLAKRGLPTRIVETKTEPARESKALAVNPRTLEILEPTGVTQRMLELGTPIHGARFKRRGRIIASISFNGIHRNYPFMLALSQATTERLLTEALEAAGGRIERGVTLVECRTLGDRVEAVLESSSNHSRETVTGPWMLAADGAHSVARQQMEVDFPGSTFAKEWYLADVPLRTKLPTGLGHVFYLDAGGLLFLIPVVDDVLTRRPGEPVWRVIGNRPDPLAQLVEAEPAGPPIWTSQFRVAHRINATLATGGVYFAGDAAHVHSPIGARGMNLGLEDSKVFSDLVLSHRLSEYSQLRRPVDRRVVRQVELLTRIASPESGVYRFAREYVLPLALKIPFLRNRAMRTLTGLDHELPHLVSEATSTERHRGQISAAPT